MLYAVRRLPQTRHRARTPLRLRVRPVLATPLRGLATGIAAFEVGNIAATLLILRATEVLTPARGAETAMTLAIGLYVAYNVAAAIASLFAGRAVDRRDSVTVLTAGVSLFGGAYVSLVSTGASLVVLAGAFVTAGVAIGCVETAEHAAVATHVPESVRGSAFGLLAAGQAFGNLIASSVAGLLWTAVSPAAAFTFAATLMGVALLALRSGTPTAPVT